MKHAIICSIIGIITISHMHAQETTSNIRTYTPSKLLGKGTFDVKWFNNLYTQTKAENNGSVVTVPRSNYFNTSIEAFTGISENKKINVGFLFEYRSNTFNNTSVTSVFNFKNEAGASRTGLGHIAPSVKIAPFKKLARFSIQSSFFIPLHKKESNANGFLTQKSFIWQNRFFYDYTFKGDKFQLFSEIGTRLFLGKKREGFANNSIEVAPGAFLSYFPNNKFTILGFVQHAQLIEINNNFSQNYTALGLGTKYQINSKYNVEALYAKFVRGKASGLGQSFNIGLRAIL